MADIKQQKRFWNWQDEDSTLDLNNWLNGIIDSGLYRGFDPEKQGMTLVLAHQLTGATRTKSDKTTQDKFGVVISKQGVVVNQLEPIRFEIEPTTALKRVDVVVMEHEYKELVGGIEATYKVIKDGGENGSGLTSPNTQVILGYLHLPPNCNDLANATYVKAKTPTLANRYDFVEKEGGMIITDLNAAGNTIVNLKAPINNNDAATKLYVDTKVVEAIVNATETQRGVVRLATQQEATEGTNNNTAMTPAKVKAFTDNITANQQEVIEGNVTKLVTAKTLHNKNATETQKGLSRIATQQEVIEGVDDNSIVTPYKLHKVLGYTQKIVELGTWDLNSVAETNISHNYDWWNKVIAIDVCLVSNTLNRFQLNPTTELTENNIKIVVRKPDLPHIDFSQFSGNSLNRGYAIFTIKNDIVQPTSTIVVNAGADQVYEKMFLGLGKPTIKSVKHYIQARDFVLGYGDSHFLIAVDYTLGQGLDMGATRLEFRIVEDGENWQGESDTYPPNYILDLDGMVRSHAGKTLGIRTSTQVGASYVYSEEATIEIPAFGGRNVTTTTINARDNTDLVKDRYEVNGFVQSVGATITSRDWQVVAGDGAIEKHGDRAYFTPNTFGTHTLRFSAQNEQGMAANDDINITITQKTNKKPTARLIFTDTNSSDDWTTDLPPQLFGARPINVKATGSSDEDGYIIAYEYQYKRPNSEDWLHYSQMSIKTSDSFLSARYRSSYSIFGTAVVTQDFMSIDAQDSQSGQFQFRCRVQDNYGVWSDWSNILKLNITQGAVKPLDTFTLNPLSNNERALQSQVSIAPLDRVEKLEFRISYSKIVQGTYYSGHTKQAQDIMLMVGSNYREFIGGFESVKTIDLTAHKASIMALNLNLMYHNQQQAFFGNGSIRIAYNFNLIAYDSLGREIGNIAFGRG